MKTMQWVALAAILFSGAAGAQTSSSTTMSRANGSGNTTTVTSGNVKDDLFAGTNVFEKNATNVTEITQGPRTLDMVNGKDESRAHRTLLNVVRTYSYDKDGLYNMADVDVFRNKLNTGGWECSVHERNLKTGSSTDVCEKPRTDGLKESAIITVSPRSLTFIHTIRKASPGDQGSTDALGVVLGAHGPELAMLDGKMALMEATMQTMSAKLGSTGEALKTRMLMESPGDGSTMLVIPRSQVPGADRDIIVDTDINPPSPGNSFQMKVIAPPAPAASAAPAAPAPNPQP